MLRLKSLGPDLVVLYQSYKLALSPSLVITKVRVASVATIYKFQLAI